MSPRSGEGILDYLTQRYGHLKRMLTRRLGSAELASDVLHDTYLRLCIMPSLPERENPGAYLMRIALNIAIDTQRKQSRIACFDDVQALLETLEDISAGPERIVQSKLDLDQVCTYIDNMPEQRRLVLILVHWEELSHQEVATRLGISRRTVSNELARAHAELSRFSGADE